MTMQINHKYSMFVITQAFAGHLGDLELTALSIASTVIGGFDLGLLLGMASALETLCGQDFGAKKYYMLGVYMQRRWIVLFICCVLLLPLYLFASPVLKLLGQPDDVAELSRMVSIWMASLHFTFTFQFPLKRFLLSQLKNMVIAWGTGFSLETFSGLWEFAKLSAASGAIKDGQCAGRHVARHGTHVGRAGPRILGMRALKHGTIRDWLKHGTRKST
ncbi:protein DETOXIFICATION 27 [Citrus sinensis]|uniref:Protein DETOXIFICATION 27 n=1 Tax=Citrus sinensis TaxID=2711 RepID=A0ACB8J5V3_CITSI|nr:protein DETOXIFICATION 27 [Citrus sinensis]